MENKNRNTAAIGVFDSGVGGLTVTREIMRQLPNENVVYFGDTARVPYGSKSKNNIIRFSRQIIRFLKTKNVKVQKQRSRARPIPKKSGNLCRRQKSSESHVRYSYRW